MLREAGPCDAGPVLLLLLLSLQVGCIEDMARTLDLPPGGRTAFGFFVDSAEYKLRLCGLITVALAPLVPATERDLFESWLRDNADRIAGMSTNNPFIRPLIAVRLTATPDASWRG